MTAVRSQPLLAPTPSARIPPLENGDRLTRAEFERRYLASPHVKKAELIEGVVYMPSPVRVNRHAAPHLLLSGWLFHYLRKTPGLKLFGDNATVRLDEDNEPQPDLFLALGQGAGGKATLSDDDYLEGAPDLVCEVSASSVSIDLHAKLNVYRRNGVREYLVWRTEDRAVDWFILKNGCFEPIPPEERILKSRAFPGLWLNVAALISGDLEALVAAIEEGVKTSEHQQLINALGAR
jgi:Uma2 family endonuclease